MKFQFFKFYKNKSWNSFTFLFFFSCKRYFYYYCIIYHQLLAQILHSIIYWKISSIPFVQVSADQRARLLMSTERLNKTGERVRESRKTMLETEELGVSILQDLHQQRQSLLHAHGTVSPTLSNVVVSTLKTCPSFWYSFAEPKSSHKVQFCY